MKIIFMGTPDFACGCLDALIENKHDVAMVITQPDKKKGRGHKMLPPPVKEKALNYGIEVYQPETLKDNAIMDTLERINPDLIVVVAYGKILPSYILDYPKYGCINVHASLLPKLRGAAPINWSIITGEEETGVTTMLMDKGLDTGDMLVKKTVKIEDDETAGTLHDKLSVLGAEALMETISQIENGTLNREEQAEFLSSYAPMINKSDCLIDLSMNYKELYNRMRGLMPYPGPFTYFKTKMVKFTSVSLGEKTDSKDYGTIWGYFPDKGLGVVAKGGIIYVDEFQFESSKKMKVSEYLKGHEILSGDYFSDERA